MFGNPFSTALPLAPFPLMLREAACWRGETEVFAGLDMMIEGGALWLIRGDNGAGKTTLLRLLAGMLRAAGGVVSWGDGQSPRKTPERALFIGHADALKPALTVGENLGFWAGFSGFAESPWPQASDPFGVWAYADVPLRALSAGQRRRVALTRLAFSAAPLWLLDEPVTALDAAGQRTVWELAAAHRRRGGAVVATTHAPMNLPDAQEMTLGGLR
ncbi:heme ABC exporter ATP-binding protein CcmA [Oleispirillum naphthae]|uniref:heme ABC exporter ATP-binding protein CcmA n=1 Tax=Oleispirillum naphthae TaxID=2838853 RepID=UPI0030825A26